MPILGNRLQMGGLGSSQTRDQFIASLAPVGWWKLRDASSPAVNSGSAGNALDLVATAVAFDQTGVLGPHEAIALNSATSRLQCPNHASLAALTDFEYVFLINPATAGESSFGGFMFWGNGSDYFICFQAALSAVKIVLYNSVGTSFTTLTSAGLAAGTWQGLSVAYSDAGDRKARIRKMVGGVVTELPYTAQPALTGTFKAPTSTFNLFNDSTQAFTFDGLADEALAFNGSLSNAQRTRYAQMSVP